MDQQSFATAVEQQTQFPQEFRSILLQVSPKLTDEQRAHVMATLHAAHAAEAASVDAALQQVTDLLQRMKNAGRRSAEQSDRNQESLPSLDV